MDESLLIWRRVLSVPPEKFALFGDMPVVFAKHEQCCSIRIIGECNCNPEIIVQSKHGKARILEGGKIEWIFDG